MGYTVDDLIMVSRITKRAREIQYNTESVKQPYESDDEEIEKYNVNKDYFKTYRRGTWWFKNSQKQIEKLLQELYEGKRKSDSVTLSIPTKRIALVNNFTIIS